jgi:hypothetical protein
LQRGGVNLVLGCRWREVEQGPNIPAHRVVPPDSIRLPALPGPSHQAEVCRKIASTTTRPREHEAVLDQFFLIQRHDSKRTFVL